MMKNKEIEIKLRLSDLKSVPAIKARIAKLAAGSFAGWQRTEMKAVYFDTPDGYMQKHKIAYRIRQENKNIVATYKSGNVNKEGVFIRVEVNKNVKSLQPDISVFADEPSIWPMLRGLENACFIAIVRTDFMRESAVIDVDGSLIEAAVDLGSVWGKNAHLPICEVELELKDGDEDKLIELKNTLQDEFALAPSSVSKYHQGLILAGLA